MSQYYNPGNNSNRNKNLRDQQLNQEEPRRQGSERDREDREDREDRRGMTPPTGAPQGTQGMGQPTRMIPPTGAPQGAPGMGQPPRTAPPNFIPEAPGMERGPMGRPGPGPSPTPFPIPSQYPYPSSMPGYESEQYGYGRGRREEYPVNPREIRRCLYHFTFIWLINGNSFWFYPTFVGRQYVQGFRWRRDRWEFDTINLRRILFFRCF